ncbi:MAG: hypothetical protein IKR59_06820 [Lachnospiraceae bacterium]|nr:hypothetical protein [Lachnospiraceae bacterium]
MRHRRWTSIAAAAVLFCMVLLSCCGSRNTIEWRVYTMMSSSDIWIPLKFDFEWDRIEISCTEGEFMEWSASLLSQIYRGREAVYTIPSRPVYWFFMNGGVNQAFSEENVVKKSQLDFKVFRGEELIHQGKIKIRQTKKTSMYYSYKVVLKCPTLNMTPLSDEPKNNQGIIRPVSEKE